MNANQYPVTLGFKQTFMPYYGKGGTVGAYHHGIDYGAPSGAPIVVSGVTIGTVGATGTVTGAHLHVDKSKYYPSKPSDYVDPSDWTGISGTVIFAGDLGSAGKTVVVGANGYYYRFLHMSEINVKIGDVISMSKITKAQEQVISLGVTGNKPGKGYDYRFTGLPSTQGNIDKMVNFWKDQSRVPTLVKQVELLTKENKTLKAQTGNLEANLIGQALLKLIASFGYKK
jgi:murein DD-endopeptidase MepM/ murein hydrolase activator NlpD